MSEAIEHVVSQAADVNMAILALALLVAFARLLRGPSLPDRVMSLDMIGTIAMGMMVVYTANTGRAVYLDVAIAMALISFLGTVAFAHFIERRGLG